LGLKGLVVVVVARAEKYLVLEYDLEQIFCFGYHFNSRLVANVSNDCLGNLSG
jgi:hypothetical protein